MNATVAREEPAPVRPPPHKPKWWTDSLETSWNNVKAEVIRDWDKLVVGETELEHRVDHEAVAFGFGARYAFHDFKVWGAEVEELLKADWKETGHDAQRAWDEIRAAARHGWERVAG